MHYLKTILSAFLLCACLFEASAGRKDRGIVSLKEDRTPFMTKGSWTIGGSASGSTYSINNYGLSVIQCSGGSGYGISVKPGCMYAIGNDMAIGITGTYSRNLLDLASAGVSVGQISLDVKNLYSLSHKFGAAFIFRKYLPLGHTGRFTLYVDASLQGSGGQSKIYNREENDIVGTYQTTRGIDLSVNPGLAMYVTPHMMMSLGVGIVGIGYSWTDQVHNQIAEGSRNGFGASYTLNILALSLGVYYCF